MTRTAKKLIAVLLTAVLLMSFSVAANAEYQKHTDHEPA